MAVMALLWHDICPVTIAIWRAHRAAIHSTKVSLSVAMKGDHQFWVNTWRKLFVISLYGVPQQLDISACSASTA
jgi:hypothetical protein